MITVVPATAKAEAGELLDPKSSGPIGVAQLTVCLPIPRELDQP